LRKNLKPSLTNSQIISVKLKLWKMASQLVNDCLIDIFEYLEDEKDQGSLRSCLFVNRHWCGVAVRFLWKRVRNYKTLVACLPQESKEILHENGITLPPTLKPPSFNYVAFIKGLSADRLIEEVRKIQPIDSQGLDNDERMMVLREIFKMVMAQAALKTLDLYFCTNSVPAFFSIATFLRKIPFPSFSGAGDCLRNLSELHCDSDVPPEFFHHMSQTCRRLQRLSVFREYKRGVSTGLSDLITNQRKLTHLYVGDGQVSLLLRDILMAFADCQSNARECRCYTTPLESQWHLGYRLQRHRGRWSE
jgi:hypothetical protein